MDTKLDFKRSLKYILTDVSFKIVQNELCCNSVQFLCEYKMKLFNVLAGDINIAQVCCVKGRANARRLITRLLYIDISINGTFKGAKCLSKK